MIAIIVQSRAQSFVRIYLWILDTSVYLQVAAVGAKIFRGNIRALLLYLVPYIHVHLIRGLGIALYVLSYCAESIQTQRRFLTLDSILGVQV